MSNQVDEPYMVHEPRQIVGELMLGKWALYAHEWLPEDTDLRTWKTTLERLCAAAGLEVEIITDHRKDMTIAWNRALPPTPEQIYTSVQAVRYHRFVGHAIKPEMVVKKAREDRYARYRPHR